MVPTFDRQGNMFQPWYNAGILPLVRELCPNAAIANNSGDNVNVGNEPAINDRVMDLIYEMIVGTLSTANFDHYINRYAGEEADMRPADGIDEVLEELC